MGEHSPHEKGFRSRRNLLVLTVLVTFVVAVFGLSMWHITQEIAASRIEESREGNRV